MATTSCHLLSLKILLSLTPLSPLENHIDFTFTTFPEFDYFLTPPLLPPWSESPSELLIPCCLQGLLSIESQNDAIEYNPDASGLKTFQWLPVLYRAEGYVCTRALHDLAPLKFLTSKPTMPPLFHLISITLLATSLNKLVMALV